MKTVISKLRHRCDSEEFRLIEKYMRTTKKHKKSLEQALNFTGVYRSQHQLLMFIADNPNVSQKELARLYGVSAATIAVSLKKLEQGGYISREVDSRDNRYNQICLTEKGKKTVEKSIIIFEEMEKNLFRGFSQEDFQKMGELLDRMWQNMEDYSHKQNKKERICK